MYYFLFFLIVVGVYLFMGGLYVKRLMTRCRKGDTQYVFDPKDLVAVLFAASFYGLLLLLNLFFYKPSNLYDYNGFYFLGHHLPFYILFIFFLGIRIINSMSTNFLKSFWRRKMVSTLPFSFVGILASMIFLYMSFSPLLVSVGVKYIQGPARLMTFEIVNRGKEVETEATFYYYDLKPVEEQEENISLDVSRDSVGDLDYWALTMTDKLCVPYVRLFDASHLFRVRVPRDEFFDHDSDDRIKAYVAKDFFGQFHRVNYEVEYYSSSSR